MESIWVEVVGLVATGIVVLSFCFRSEVSLRKVNILGSLFFISYGILISSVSIIVLNILLALINIYRLIRK